MPPNRPNPSTWDLIHDTNRTISVIDQRLGLIDRRLARLETVARQVAREDATHNIVMEDLMTDINTRIETLRDKVAAQGTVIGSVRTLIQGNNAVMADLRDRLANAGVDAAHLAMVDDALSVLDANTEDLAAAVAEGTPAADEPGPSDGGTTEPPAPTPTTEPQPTPGEPAPTSDVAGGGTEPTTGPQA